MYYQRKFHIKFVLSDGNIYKGFINTEADSYDDLYNIEDIRGSFWVSKDNVGWHGEFKLDEGLIKDKRKEGYRCKPYVITNGVYRPDIKFGEVNSVSDAQRILEYCSSVKYNELPRFVGRLEDYIYTEETHCW